MITAITIITEKEVKDKMNDEIKSEVKLTKLIKVFTDNAWEQPTFLITFQVINTNNNEEIIREKVHVTNVNSRHRYYGLTPILFIRREHEKNSDVLKLAEAIKNALDSEHFVKYERDIRHAIKNVLNGNFKESQIKKSVHYDVYGEIMLKRPHKDFITLTKGMLKNVVNEKEVK